MGIQPGHVAGNIIMIIISTISLICSVVCMRIIELLNIKNSYLKSIGNLAAFTMLYELCNIFIALIPIFGQAQSTSSKSFQNYLSALRFFFVFVSLSTAVVTLSMSLYTYFTIISKANDPLTFIRSSNKLFKIAILPLTIAIIVSIAANYQVTCILYYSIRYAIIITNLLVYLLITNELWDKTDKKPENLKTEPLLVLALRLKYYPLIQVCCASGSFFMLVIFNSPNYFPVPHSSTVFGQALYIYYTISNSMSGILYFIVFLIFQPTANQYFKLNWNRILLFYPKEKCDNSMLQKTIKNNCNFSRSGVGIGSINPNILSINSSRNMNMEFESNGDASAFTSYTDHDFALYDEDEINAFITGSTSDNERMSTNNDELHRNNYSLDITHDKAHRPENRQSLLRISLDYINNTFYSSSKSDCSKNDNTPVVVNNLHEES